MIQTLATALANRLLILEQGPQYLSKFGTGDVKSSVIDHDKQLTFQRLSSVEGTVLIVSASLPLIRPVVWKLMTRLWVMTVKLSSSRSTRNRRQYLITDATREDVNAQSKGWTPRPAYVETQSNDFIPLFEMRTNGTGAVQHEVV